MKKNLYIMLIAVFLVGSVYVVAEMLVPAGIGNKNFEIEVPKGATFKQAVEILYDQKLIKDKSVFLFIGRLTGADRKIRAGYYSITGSQSPFDIFKMLKKGQIIEYEITIVEGDALGEIAEKLSEKGIIDKEDFMQLSSDKDFLSLYNIEAPSFEGYLFPDTYKIPKGMDPEDAIGMIINRMREKYSGALRARADEFGLSEREVLTLSSIIEKEARTDEERYLISAVYHNRLRKGMRLQADPTAIYGIKSSREIITAKDIRTKTRYNTYFIKGLPPGPIASPGIKSIIAALYPADVPYLYFVSNDDGTHQFSITAEQHLAAVRSYREKRARDTSGENKEETEEGAKRNGSS